METRVSSVSHEVIISDDRPVVLIGECINPAGRKRLAEALQTGNMDLVCWEAIRQVEAGADILDVNVGGPGIDEEMVLPLVVQTITGVVDVPLSLDSDNPRALEAALRVYHGKPIVNSVTGQESSLNEILPIVKEYGAAIVGLTMDDDGIPQDPNHRMVIAKKILERTGKVGIPQEDVIIDCLAMTLATESQAAMVTLETIYKVHLELGVNQTLGVSNVSFGLPERDTLNSVFSALAIGAGVTCLCVNVARVSLAVLAADLILGKDLYARRYISSYRERQGKRRP